MQCYKHKNLTKHQYDACIVCQDIDQRLPFISTAISQERYDQVISHFSQIIVYF